MARYIDAERLSRDVISSWDRDTHKTIEASRIHRQEHHHLMSIIEKQPTADVVEVKRGEWIRNEPNPEQMKEFHDLGIGKAMALKSIYWSCSCCGTWGTPRYKYCPNCGADMRGAK